MRWGRSLSLLDDVVSELLHVSLDLVDKWCYVEWCDDWKPRKSGVEEFWNSFELLGGGLDFSQRNRSPVTQLPSPMTELASSTSPNAEGLRWQRLAYPASAYRGLPEGR